jgi:type II secretory pathway component PulC
MRQFRILNVLLGILILLAGWRLADVVQRAAPDVPADPSAGRVLTPAVPAPPRRLRVLPAVKEIRSKDLFDVSRQPIEAAGAQPTPSQTPAPPPTLKLTGVIFVGTFREAVVIDETQGNKQLRLREGEDISGYKVSSIERDRVALTGGSGEEVQLQLLVSTGASGVKAGPGGKATPKPKKPKAGKIGKDQGDKSDIQKRRADARKRAQRARERLKRLREEAANR